MQNNHKEWIESIENPSTHTIMQAQFESENMNFHSMMLITISRSHKNKSRSLLSKKMTLHRKDCLKVPFFVILQTQKWCIFFILP